jgi:hypothetical protein
MPLQVSQAGGVEVALRLGNGDPLIITKAVGFGRVVLVTTSADLSWTSLPLWTSYVPLILEIQDYATSGRSEARTVVTGDSIGQVFPKGMLIDMEKVVIAAPRGEPTEQSLSLTGQHLRWLFTDTVYCGVYRVETRSSSGSSQISLFAANSPIEESDVNSWGFRNFIEATIPKARCVSESELPEIVPSDFRSVPRGSPLSRWLLSLAVVILLCELYLGRQTPGT